MLFTGNIIQDGKYFRLCDGGRSYVVENKNLDGMEIFYTSKTSPLTAEGFEAYLMERAERERWTEEERKQAAEWVKSFRERGSNIDAGITVEFTVIDEHRIPVRFLLAKTFWDLPSVLQYFERVDRGREKELERLGIYRRER